MNEEMSDEEARRIILEELWKHRHEPLISFDQALKDLSISTKTKRGILNLFESDGLIDYTLKPLSEDNLGNGRMTSYGVQVAEGKQRAPSSIVIQTGGIRTNNVSSVERMTVASDQARISPVKKRDVDWVERISRGWRWVKALFGFES